MKRIVIIGAGGFAREVAWILREINEVEPRYTFAGYAVSDTSKLGDRDSRTEVVGDFDWLERHTGDFDCLALGIGSPPIKARLAEELERRLPGADWPPLLHPSVRFDRPSCRIGRGVVLSAGVIATVNVVFGDFARADINCTVSHEAVIGRFTALNPGANVSGGVVLGDGVLVGTGAQILQYLRVGNNATIGAGAVVTKDVPEGETVVGVPAKPHR